MERIVVYTDGSCQGNPGPGGWAWITVGGRFAAGPRHKTTNQRMEIKAAYEAVKALQDEPGIIEIVSDSRYVVDCFNKQWWKGWHRKGWKNAQGKPVANKTLWEPFINLVNERGNVEFRWVKGHSGDEMNERADALANYAANAGHGISGKSFDEMIQGLNKNRKKHRKRVEPWMPQARGGRMSRGSLYQ